MLRNYPGAARCVAGKRSADSGLRENPVSPGSPDRRAVLKPNLPAPAAEELEQSQDPKGAEREEIRPASKSGSEFSVPERSEEASQSPRRRPGRSPRLALFPHQARGVELNRNCLAGS